MVCIWHAINDDSLEHLIDSLTNNYNIILWNTRASRFGKITAVTILLEKGASVSVRNSFGSTPLHLACEYGHHEIVKVCIELKQN